MEAGSRAPKFRGPPALTVPTLAIRRSRATEVSTGGLDDAYGRELRISQVSASRPMGAPAPQEQGNAAESKDSSQRPTTSRKPVAMRMRSRSVTPQCIRKKAQLLWRGGAAWCTFVCVQVPGGRCHVRVLMAEQEARDERAGGTSGRGEAVLVVMRPWDKRVLLRAQLREEGVLALAVPTLLEGMEWLLDEAASPRLILYDTSAQDDAHSDLRRLAELSAALPVLVIASRAEAPLVHSLGLGEPLLRPVTIGEVCARIRGLLASGRRRGSGDGGKARR